MSNIVAFPGQNEDLAAESLKTESFWRAIFRKANFFIEREPWESWGGEELGFEDKNGRQWVADLKCDGMDPATLKMREVDGTLRLEATAMASTFLQGEDYDLNVQHAPESWDDFARDVLVLRARRNSDAPRQPRISELPIIAAGLDALAEACGFSDLQNNVIGPASKEVDWPETF